VHRAPVRRAPLSRADGLSATLRIAACAFRCGGWYQVALESERLAGA
jgi:hypothetical protein